MNRKILPYLIARGITVVYRPLVLFVLSIISVPASNILGLVFVNTTLTMLVIQADSHRFFYKSHFKGERTSFFDRNYFQYLGLITLMITLGMLVSFFLSVAKLNNAPFIISCILYFIIEKFFDEILRYDLFAKEFSRWAKLSILRFLVFIVSIIPVFFWKSTEVLIISFACNFLFCFLTFQIVNGQLKKLFSFCLRKYFQLLKKGVESVNIIFIFWILSISASIFNNYDRLFIYFFQKDQVAYLLIIFMLFSGIQLMVEFFFTSISRNDILKGLLDNMFFLRSKKFLGIIISATLLSGVVYFLFHKYNRVYKYEPDLRVAVLVAVSQICLSVIAILREINFWKFNQRRLFTLEIINISFLIGIFYTLYLVKFSFSFISFLTIFNIVFFIRTMTYVVSIKVPETNK